VRSWSGFLLLLLVGILFIIAGVVTIQNPVLAATVLTAILGISLLAGGFIRILMAFKMKEGTPWIWVALSGLVTLLLGLVILARWPVSSLYTLGIFLGVDMLVLGASWVAAGFDLRGQDRTWIYSPGLGSMGSRPDRR
jgi:uncharacterized membrane protein HdeD (DUF308 family)